jgi:hypothetical protein
MGQRTSYFQRGGDADNARAAVDFADQLGVPLNLCISVNGCFFSDTLRDEKRLARAQERIRHSLNRRGFALYWYWTRELSKSGYPHTHIHAHDPFNDDGVTFQRLLRLAFAPDGRPDHCGVHVQPVDDARGGVVGWWRYLFKGLEPLAARQRGINHKQQGEIVGKRCGLTQNLNRAARQRHGSLNPPGRHCDAGDGWARVVTGANKINAPATPQFGGRTPLGLVLMAAETDGEAPPQAAPRTSPNFRPRSMTRGETKNEHCP